MSRLKLVFDLDDTLYSERQFAISGFRACEAWLQREYGATIASASTPERPAMTIASASTPERPATSIASASTPERPALNIVEDMTRLLDDGHMRALFPQVLRQKVPHAGEDLVERFIDVYRYHDPQIALYDDAGAALDHFGALGPLGLITDGQHDVQSSKVAALRLAPRFRHIVYTSALGGRQFSKPHPLAYERMEAALGEPGDRFVYVGDNPAKDFVVPNQRGWISVQVDRPLRIHARAATAPGGTPQHVIASLADLPALLANV